MSRYSYDPYWLTARFPSKCSKCGCDIKKGARIFYYPRGKSALCEKDECGGQASRDFNAAKADEEFMTGSFGV